MGGRGSGGHNRVDDETKKARGTYRRDRSDEAYDERAAAKVIQGPWLSEIPDPEFPLNPTGKAKYDEWTKELFEQNKLTAVSVTIASQAALLFQQIHKAASESKSVSAHTHAKFLSAVKALDIAQNAKVTASPERNAFSGAGFSNSRSKTARLLPYRAASS